MICAYFLLTVPETEAEAWAPPALRDSECQLRKSNAAKWSRTLQSLGVEVDPDDIGCLQNLDSNWEECPLFMRRGGKREMEEITTRIMPDVI